MIIVKDNDWLKKHEKHYRVEPCANVIRMKELFEAVKQGLDNSNHFSVVKVQAKEEHDHILVFENSEFSQLCYFLLEFNEDDNSINIYEKLMLKEPVLPNITEERKPYCLPRFNFGIFLFGLILFVFPAFIYKYWYDRKVKKFEKISEHNASVISNRRAWDKAWDKWENEILDEAYLPDTEEKLDAIEKITSNTLTIIVQKICGDAKFTMPQIHEYTKRQILLQALKRKQISE